MKFSNLAMITVLLLLNSCGSKDTAQDVEPATESSMEQSTTDVALDGQPVTLAGVTFSPPSVWQNHGPKGMRKADYSFGPLEGDSDSASVTVFYFGSAGAGGVMDNINRWIGQMSLPDGGDAGEASIQSEFEVDGMAAHLVEVAGTFHASMGDPQSGNKIEKENYRLYAIVVESPEGSVFFKLTGPDETAKEMAVAFVAMVKGLKKI